MKCPKCGKEIPEDQPLDIIGTANVVGTATLKDLRETGVEWVVEDSTDEKVECPHCQEYVSIEQEEEALLGIF